MRWRGGCAVPGSNQWDEFGTTTGRARRVGWLDLVQLKICLRHQRLSMGWSSPSSMCFQDLDSVHICTSYEDGGPVYETLPGWGDLEGLGSRDALPLKKCWIT